MSGDQLAVAIVSLSLTSSPCWVHMYYVQSELIHWLRATYNWEGKPSNVVSRVIFTSHLLSIRSEFIKEEYGKITTLVMSIGRQTLWALY